MIDVSVKQGHYGYAIRFTIRSKGTLIDFTNYTLNWKIWVPTDATGTKWEIEGSIIETGVVDFDVTSDDFDEAGSFEAEIEWTKSGIVDGSETFTVTVVPSR